MLLGAKLWAGHCEERSNLAWFPALRSARHFAPVRAKEKLITFLLAFKTALEFPSFGEPVPCLKREVPEGRGGLLNIKTSLIGSTTKLSSYVCKKEFLNYPTKIHKEDTEIRKENFKITLLKTLLTILMKDL